MTRLCTLLLCAALIGACSAPEPIPDFRYYRLAPATLPARGAALLDRPLVVEAFRADGVHGERPILYATDADSLKISQYHYQLWNDPPPTMIQRRLIDHLTALGASELVSDRLGMRIPAYRLRGTVYRFERVVVDSAPEAVVAMRLRLDKDGEDVPYLTLDRTVRVPIGGDRVEDAAIALSAGVDQIADALVAAMKARRPSAG
jgi:ABC-type uncharacterized transport system auxiliary subunit